METPCHGFRVLKGTNNFWISMKPQFEWPSSAWTEKMWCIWSILDGKNIDLWTKIESPNCSWHFIVCDAQKWFHSGAEQLKKCMSTFWAFWKILYTNY